jgi:hypothetical protein
MKIPEIIADFNAIAEVVHETLRAYDVVNFATQTESWRNTPETEKNNLTEDLEYILTTTNVTPKQMHDRWWNKREAEGWVYGPVNDLYGKTSPFLVDYEALPDFVRRRYNILLLITQAMTEPV